MIVDLARVDHAALTYERKNQLSPLSAARGPRQAAFRRNARVRTRMHEPLHLPRHKAVVDEEIFFDAELSVAAFQITSAIIFDAMAQDEVLRARGSANWISLHKTELVEHS